MWNIVQMFPKVRKSAQGCSKCKIVLQTQKSAQKVLSAIGKGLTKVGHSSEAARLIHRRKTAGNSLQLLQSNPNSPYVTHDISSFHSLSCFKTPLHWERIKGRKSLQPFPSEAIDWGSAWTPRYRWKIATRPETQITHTQGGRQSLAPVDINRKTTGARD